MSISLAASKLSFAFPDVKTPLNIPTPATGKVHPVKSFPYNEFGIGVAISLEQGKIIAPFSGQVISFDLAIAKVVLKAPNGLKLLLQLPEDWRTTNGLGIKPLVKLGQIVRTGEQLFALDIYQMQRQTKPFPLYAIIINHQKLHQVFVANKHVTCNNDILFSISIKKKNEQ